MAPISVSAKQVMDGTPVIATVQYDFGDSLEDSIARFGDQVVFGVFQQQAKIKLQSFMRGLIAAEKTQEEIEEAVANWTVSVGPTQTPVDPEKAMEQALTKIGKLPADKQQEAYQKLAERLQALQSGSAE